MTVTVARSVSEPALVVVDPEPFTDLFEVIFEIRPL